MDEQDPKWWNYFVVVICSIIVAGFAALVPLYTYFEFCPVLHNIHVSHISITLTSVTPLAKETHIYCSDYRGD